MKVYKTNISGFSGFLLLVLVVILGIAAFTFLLIAVAVIAGIFIVALLVYRLLLFLGIKKKPKIPVVEYSWENTKEIPESTDNEKEDKPAE
jgi:hypothetical protein